jgi:hypothetical protein
MVFRYVEAPHPHVVIDEIVEPAVYARMRFPDELISADSPWGLTASDVDAYREALSDPDWAALHDELCGEAFVHSVIGEFAPEMRARGCLVDPDRPRLVHYTESRAEKELALLAGDGDPCELFTRLDFQMKREGGYREFVHLDWPRRIVGGIMFFSDAAEEGLEGGELAFYRDRGYRDDRWCHDPELAAAYAPRHNFGVIFLNSNQAFHGPRAITRLAGRRRWLYYTISSKVDVWPRAQRAA